MSAVRISGRLVDDARHACDVRGFYSLHLTLELPHEGAGQPVLVRVVKPYGSGGAAALACANRSRQLRRGVRVEISAEVMRRVRGRLQADRVSSVMAPDLTVDMRGATT